MNLWVWVVALVPRFDESVDEVQGENEEQGERRKKGENEESELEYLKLKFYIENCLCQVFLSFKTRGFKTRFPP